MLYAGNRAPKKSKGGCTVVNFVSNFVETSIMPGESVVFKGEVSPWAMAKEIVVSTLFFFLGLGTLRVPSMALMFIFLGALLLGFTYLQFKSIECCITTKRIIAKFGVIQRSTIDLNLSRAESIRLEQGILGRIFDFGSLVVSGAGAPQAPVPGIIRPMEFRRAFQEAQEHVSHKTPIPVGANHAQ